ncbi:MAG: cyclic nucleotide-binding domain-containing protein [Verrucomicrobiota bacterium]
MSDPHPHGLPEGASGELPGEPNATGWEPLRAALPALGVLAMMNQKALGDLSGYGELRAVHPGDTVIQEDAEQGRLYIIISGAFDIFSTVDGKEIHLARVGEGECFGEASLLIPAPASASVRAVQPGSLWSIDRDGLSRYLAAHAGGGGALLMGMAQCLAARLRASNDQIISHFMAQARTLTMARTRPMPIKLENTKTEESFFGKLKSSLSSTGTGRKPKIRTEIKL